MAAVGDRVTEAGLSEYGEVVAIRPQGMVDVRYPGQPIMRRPAASLIRANPHPAMRANPFVVSEAVQFAQQRAAPASSGRHQRAPYQPVGEVRSIDPAGRYSVAWEDGFTGAYPEGSLRRADRPFRGVRAHPANRENPAKEPSLANAYLDRVALAIYAGMVAKGKPEGAATTRVAYAIATKQLQKQGSFAPGTRQLTAQGVARAKAKLAEMDTPIKSQAVEHMLAGARKAQGYRVVKLGAKKFEVQPGGKRFTSEAKALAYAAELGQVDPEAGRQVRALAQEAGAAKREAAKEAKRIAREAQQLALPMAEKAPKQLESSVFAPGDLVVVGKFKTPGIVRDLPARVGEVVVSTSYEYDSPITSGHRIKEVQHDNRRPSAADREMIKLVRERLRSTPAAPRAPQMPVRVAKSRAEARIAKTVAKAGLSSGVRQAGPGRFEIVGTSKWFSTRAKAEAWLAKNG